MGEMAARVTRAGGCGVGDIRRLRAVDAGCQAAGGRRRRRCYRKDCGSYGGGFAGARESRRCGDSGAAFSNCARVAHRTDRAPSNPPQSALPVGIDLQLPKGISAAEEWIVPEAQKQLGPNGQTKGYVGDVAFKRRLLIDQHASPGPLMLRCTVGCQVCNEALCTRPAPVELKATVDVDEE